jgi:hypothetical protein
MVLKTEDVVLLAIAGSVVLCLVAALAVVLAMCWCSRKSRKGDRVNIWKEPIDLGKVFGATGGLVVSV